MAAEELLKLGGMRCVRPAHGNGGQELDEFRRRPHRKTFRRMSHDIRMLMRPQPEANRESARRRRLPP